MGQLIFRFQSVSGFWKLSRQSDGYNGRYNACSCVVIVLCLLFTIVADAKPLDDKTASYETDSDEEPWLADGSFYDIDYMGGEIPQADGHRPISMDIMCPPVPKSLPAGGCDLKVCRSDRECASQEVMCCYNGCVYTCLAQVRPAAHFDWLREPRRRLQFGRSWLVPGRDQVQESDAMLCSTTPPDDDSDPLLCPHGFQCVIDDQGAPSKGVPDTGHCVQSADSSSEETLDFDIPLLQALSDGVADEAAPRHHCDINNGISKLMSGHSLILNGKNCLCYETKLLCEDEE